MITNHIFVFIFIRRSHNGSGAYPPAPAAGGATVQKFACGSSIWDPNSINLYTVIYDLAYKMDIYGLAYKKGVHEKAKSPSFILEMDYFSMEVV